MIYILYIISVSVCIIMTYDVCMGKCQYVSISLSRGVLLTHNRIPPVHHNAISYNDLQTPQPLVKLKITVTKRS